MAYFLPETASLQPDPTAKNRVWGFFGESVSVNLESRRAALETHRENYGESRETASGIPLWPSRDPIGERGGVNLYGFGSNSPTSGFDYLGWDFRDVDPISGGRVPPDNRVPTLIPPRKGGLPRPVEPVTPDPTIPPDYDLPDELDGPGKGGKGTRRKAVGEVALDAIDAAGAFLTAHKARSWCDDAHAASGQRCGCCYINIRYFRKLQGGVTAPRVYEFFALTYYGGKSCTTRRNDRAMNEGETADQGPDNSWFPEIIRLDQSTIADRGMLTEERTYPR